MRVSLQKVGVGIGIGLADEALNWMDRKQGWARDFRNATDLGRLVLTGGGLVMQIFNMMPAFGESLAQSTMPLLVKSVAHVISPALVRGSIPMRTAGVRQIVPPIPAGGGYRSI